MIEASRLWASRNPLTDQVDYPSCPADIECAASSPRRLPKWQGHRPEVSLALTLSQGERGQGRGKCDSVKLLPRHSHSAIAIRYAERPHLSPIRLLSFAALASVLVACGGNAAQGAVEVPEPTAAVATPSISTSALAAPTAVATPAPAAPIPAARAAAPTLMRDVAAPNVVAVSAVLLDEDSASVLYEKDAHAPMQPASLTKIATAIAAIDSGADLDGMVETDVDSASMRGSTVMGLQPGDRFSLRDLLYGLMLPSGNDAALAIGRYVAGGDATFVARLNALLGRLGLTEAHFTNAHGLGGGPGHVISAYNLALLARYAMGNAVFRQIVATGQYTAKGSRTIELANVDTFLYSYAGADGVKTGYTRGAGRTLVASATRNGHRLYAVVLNSADRDGDATRLLNWGFANFRWPEAVQ